MTTEVPCLSGQWIKQESQSVLKDAALAGKSQLNNISIGTGEEFMEFLQDHHKVSQVPNEHDKLPRNGTLLNGNGNHHLRYEELSVVVGLQRVDSVCSSGMADKASERQSLSRPSAALVSGVSDDSQTEKIKFTCSSGGKILPRPSDGKLRYVGGETRIVAVRKNISWEEIVKRTSEYCNQPYTIKYQLPGEDLDALISVCCSEDLQNMIDEYTGLKNIDGSLRLKIFLIPVTESEIKCTIETNPKHPDYQYIVTVNGIADHSQIKNNDSQCLMNDVKQLKPVVLQEVSVDQNENVHSQAVIEIPSVKQPVLYSQTDNLKKIHDDANCIDEKLQTAKQDVRQTVGVQADLFPNNTSSATNNGDINKASKVNYDPISVLHNPLVSNQMIHASTATDMNPVPDVAMQQISSNHLEMPPSEPAFNTQRISENQQYIGTRAVNGEQGNNTPPDYNSDKYFADLVSGFSNKISNESAVQMPSSHQKVMNNQKPMVISPDNSGLDAVVQQISSNHLEKSPSEPGLNTQRISENTGEVNGEQGNNTQPDYTSEKYFADLIPGFSNKKSTESAVQLPSSHQKVMNNQKRTIISPDNSGLDAVMQQISSNHLEKSPSEPSLNTQRISENNKAVNGDQGNNTLPDDNSEKYIADLIPGLSNNISNESAVQLASSHQKEMNNQKPIVISPDNSALELPLFFGSSIQNSTTGAGLKKQISLIDDDFFNYTSQVVGNLGHEGCHSNIQKGVPSIKDKKEIQLDLADHLGVVTNFAVCSHVDAVNTEGHPSNATEVESTSYNSNVEVAATDKDCKDGSFSNALVAEMEADLYGLQIIKNDELEELRELGFGTHGTVYHGRWRGSDVAIKRIKKCCFVGRSSEEERLNNDFWREARILSNLHHPNVVAFYGVVPDAAGGNLATVTEFMPNGSLRNVLLQKDRSLDRRRKLLIAMDAAFGMEYLHSKNIVHFDLKCDNLLVDMRDPQRPVCKLGDFGLSKIKRNTLISGGVKGTLPWMAPELLTGSTTRVSEKVDVFSFGITMWEILTGEEPYANMHCGAIIGGIVNDTLRPIIPDQCEPEWRKLMEQCWSTDPTSRPSFTEVTNRLRTMFQANGLKKGSRS